MFQMLIVDDELPALSAIKCAIDWERLGVDTIYTATNIRMAKNILTSTQIQLVLCDIEMPRGNGLMLLEWMRKASPFTVSVILTSHADFDYAKTAIHLGSLDYLLKPAKPAELESILKKSFDLINERQKGQRWDMYKMAFDEIFWKELVAEGQITGGHDTILTEAGLRGIDLRDGQSYLLCLVNVQAWHEMLSGPEKKKVLFAMKNSIREYFTGIVFSSAETDFAAVIPYDQGLESRLEENARAFISTCNQYYCMDVCCYLGAPSSLEELHAIYGSLLKLKRSGISVNNEMICIDALSQDDKKPNLQQNDWQHFDMKELSILIESGQADVCMRELQRHFQVLSAKKKLQPFTLRYFRDDYRQMLFDILRRHNIRAHLLADNENEDLLEKASTQSVRDLLNWVENKNAKVIDLIGSAFEEPSISKTVTDYIDSHIDEGLTCESVAEHVHFNPDYLTRLFKKNEGMTLSQYIYTQKMELAKKLLLKTDLPVSAIAAKLSYTNLAQFSRTFKAFTKQTPLAFRNRTDT